MGSGTANSTDCGRNPRAIPLPRRPQVSDGGLEKPGETLLTAQYSRRALNSLKGHVCWFSSPSVEYFMSFKYCLKWLIWMNWNCKCFLSLLQITPTDKSAFFLQESHRIFIFFPYLTFYLQYFQLIEKVNFFK